MYDANKVIPGLIAFLAILTIPAWYALGNTPAPPDNEAALRLLREQGQECVESREYMRANHMELLNSWRLAAVREGQQTYTSMDGRRTVEISLTDTCLDCHADADGSTYPVAAASALPEFCNSCHDYAGVEPDCFSCHLEGRPGK